MHKEEYHVENIPVPHVKARWENKEVVLLAREELWLTRLGEKNINRKLAGKFPHHSFESIKGAQHRSTTCIKVKGSMSEPISVCKGVKQGDPMSVHLFNAVIDWALSSLDNRL